MTNPILRLIREDQKTDGPTIDDALRELLDGYFDGCNTPKSPGYHPNADLLTQEQIDEAIRVLQRLVRLRSSLKTWTTEEMRAEFEVIAFMAPFVEVRRRSDGVEGSLMFDHSPRLYHHWVQS